MSDRVAEQAVLKYLNSDNRDEYGAFRSLTTLFEKIVGPSIPHADSYDVEDEIESKEAFRGIVDQMVADGLLQSRWGERDYEASYRLTEQGVYEAAGFDQLIQDVPSEGPAELDTSATTIDSAAWTGLTATVVDARNAPIISALIAKALDSLSESTAGNFEIVQATAYLKAARELVNAPEPPSEEIWRFISRAADIVGLVGFFYAIFVQASK